jgi:hypothetical protein
MIRMTTMVNIVYLSTRLEYRCSNCSFVETDQNYHDQYTNQRKNYNYRYGNSRGYRDGGGSGGNYRYNNNNSNNNFSNEYYEENYGIGGQSQQKYSNHNAIDSNNGTTSDTHNGSGYKGSRVTKPQSNGVK